MDSSRSDVTASRPDWANQRVSGKLREAAGLLAAQAADPFRVAAYRRAADAIDGLDRDIAEIARTGGEHALDEIPGVGRGIAAAVLQLLRDGRWPYLEHLRGSADPVRVFQTLPGVGPTLARLIHDRLGVDTLEDLEAATYAGGLGQLPGIGARRAAMIRAGVTDALSRIRPRLKTLSAEPDVAVILDVDREYRASADKGSLPKIAPRRSNPTGEAWLPILHTKRGAFDFTALFSNTPRAHELHRVHDWVVIFFHADHGSQGQRTVVTERHGPLLGRRVVRGREDECLRFFGQSSPA